MANTFFVQGCRMDVRLGDDVKLPVAAMTIFSVLSVLILIPLLDRCLYPLFQRMGRPLTYLKRMGLGLIIAAFAMFVAGVVEIYRKKEPFHQQELSGKFYNASSMSIFVQVPQFALIGISETFTSITSLEFAYNQAPVEMQGLLTGLILATIGVGNWVSTGILLIIKNATKDDPWWSNEINDGHMEYLMFLLGGILILNFLVFVIVAHFYSYQNPETFREKDLKIIGKDSSKTDSTTEFGGSGSETGHDNSGYGSTEANSASFNYYTHMS